MRVHDSNLNSVTVGTRQSGRVDTVDTGRSNRYGSNGYGSQDRVSLSDLSSALARVGEESPAQTDRIQKLAAAYKAGTYRADATAAATGIVNDSIKLS